MGTIFFPPPLITVFISDPWNGVSGSYRVHQFLYNTPPHIVITIIHIYNSVLLVEGTPYIELITIPSIQW